MPDITETANLDAQIEALIRKASDCLRRQLDDVRREAERACEGRENKAETEACRLGKGAVQTHEPRHT